MEPRTPDDRVDQIMERIREEIALRKGIDSQSPPTPPPATPNRALSPRILPEPVRLPRRNGTSAFPVGQTDTYHVNDFLGFADADFLAQAFHGTLRRAPGPEELAEYMEAFRTGNLTHLEALGCLRFSEEGERIGVRIAGLSLRYQLRRFYRNVPVISYLLKWLLYAVRLPSRIDALSFDDGRLRNRLADLDELSSAAENALNEVVLKIESRFHEVENILHRLEERLSRFEWRLDSLESEKADTESVDFVYTKILEVDRISQRLAKLQSKVTELEDTEAKQSGETRSELAALREALEKRDFDEKPEQDLGETRSELAALRQTLEKHDFEKPEQDLGETRSELAALRQTLEEHNLEKSKQDLRETRSELAALRQTLVKHDLEQLTGRVGGCETRIAQGQSTVQEIQQRLQDLTGEVHDHKRNIVDQQRRLALLLEEARKRLPNPMKVDQIETIVKEQDHLLDAQYVTFEDRFRGTREDIKARQRAYLPHIESLHIELQEYPVLDIGCGRGEWLELLAESGVRSQGVDLNRVMVQQCLDLELNVEEGHCVEFLRQQKQEAFGVLTSFHLVEHLEHKTLVELIDEALRVLRPGGLLILETPNPSNLIVGSCNFYIDPTHRNPIHSSALQFLLEARGFCNTEIIRLHPFDESYRLHGSELAERISDLLYGPQDYAVLGHKA